MTLVTALGLVTAACSTANLADGSSVRSLNTDTAHASASPPAPAPAPAGAGASAASTSASTSATPAPASGGAPPSDPSADNGGQADSENTGAALPQSISGAYLVDCGQAGAQGYGCAFVNPETKAKAAITFTSPPTVTIGYSNQTTSITTSTLAPASSPWHLTFQPVPAKAELLSTITLAVVASSGTGTFTAQTVTAAFPVAGQAAAPTAAKPTFLAQDTIFFVTQLGYLPGSTPTATALNFNGAAAADALCTAIAAAGHSILPTGRTWMAYLSLEALGSVQATPVGQRLNLATTGNFVSANNTLIISAANYAAKNSFSSTIDVDETGAVVASSTQIWTGTNGANNPATGSTCSNWTSNAANVTGEYGVPSTYANWTDNGAAACDTPQHLYCVGH